MSTASKVTLAVTCATTLAIVVTVHKQQESDRKRLKQGIVRDVSRQENLVKLQQQQELEKMYRRDDSGQ